jgi:hypothetical protein
MRKRKGSRVVAALALALGGLVLAGARVDAALVICKKKRKITLREDACRKGEARLEATELGVASPRWALVDTGGAIIAQSGGIAVVQADGGFYVLDFGASQTGRAVQATGTLTLADTSARGSVLAGLCGGVQGPVSICPAELASDRHVWVATTSAGNGTQEPHAFYVSTF